METFDKSELVGLESVRLFCSWLNNNKKRWRSATKIEQSNGIDLFTARQMIEVKTSRTDGSIAIEEISDCGKPGWIYTTQSTMLVFVNPNKKYAYLVPTRNLKDYYTKTSMAHPLRSNKATNGKRGDQWISKFRWYTILELIADGIDVRKVKL